MTQTIPTVDQKLINKYFPGQVVKSKQKSTKSIVRAYVFGNGKVLFISTRKGREILAASLVQIQIKRQYELEMKNEGTHLICILHP